MPKKNQVIFIGLDGAFWDIIQKGIEAGILPTFRRLKEEGSWAQLNSTVPPFTIPSWNTISSGLNPGKLGFASFMLRKENSYQFSPYFFQLPKPKYIWDILSENGYQSAVAFTPNLHSPYPINGKMITGWVYQNKNKITYPADFINELDRLVDGFEMDVVETDFSGVVNDTTNTEKEYIERTNRITEKHFKILEYFIKENNDFIFFVAGGPDRIQHRFWDKEKIVLSHYQIIDKNLGKILGLIDESTTLLLASDHGFGSAKKSFNVNDWLIKEGYLVLHNKVKNKKLPRLHSLLKRSGMMPLIRKVLKSISLGKTKELEKKYKYLKYENWIVDWNKTKAFCYGVFGDIYLNVSGRDPNGIVDKRDYLKESNELMNRFYSDNNLRGIKVKLAKEVFGRELDKVLPDMVIGINDSINSITPTIGHDQSFSNQEGGNHRQAGMFLAYGNQFFSGKKLADYSVADVTPSILQLFNLPIPDSLNGKVIEEMFKNKNFIKYEKDPDKTTTQSKIESSIDDLINESRL